MLAWYAYDIPTTTTYMRTIQFCQCVSGLIKLQGCSFIQLLNRLRIIVKLNKLICIVLSCGLIKVRRESRASLPN